MDEGLSGFRIKSGSRSTGGGGTGGGGTKCGRWNPTAEQVKVLTDLFTSGLRTPSTDQIQKISSQLSFYGKIESKNVFYWFQNHKARERQKRRKISVQDRIHHQMEQEPKSFPTKLFAEINQVQEPHQKVIETLQLFPLNSYEESEWEKQRVLLQNECKDTTTTMFACAIVRDQIEHPPLDLRLSFL